MSFQKKYDVKTITVFHRADQFLTFFGLSSNCIFMNIICLKIYEPKGKAGGVSR
jgi:hypothetical protein